MTLTAELDAEKLLFVYGQELIFLYHHYDEQEDILCLKSIKKNK